MNLIFNTLLIASDAVFSASLRLDTSKRVSLFEVAASMRATWIWTSSLATILELATLSVPLVASVCVKELDDVPLYLLVASLHQHYTQKGNHLCSVNHKQTSKTITKQNWPNLVHIRYPLQVNHIWQVSGASLLMQIAFLERRSFIVLQDCEVFTWSRSPYLR